METSFQLNGITIKRPARFKIERFNITKSSRLTSGKMVMDLIAKKRKFYFTYTSITSKDLNVILDILWESNSMFHTLTYVENNETKTAVVYVGAIPTELWRTDALDWVWSNVTFDLIEQ